MDNSSFNPKLWLSKDKVQTNVTDEAGFQSPRPIQPDPNPSDDGFGAFWKGFSTPATVAVAATPIMPTHAPGYAPPLDRRFALAMIASAAILASSALAAWFTRSEPASPALVSPATTADTGANVQERAVNLAGPGQLVGALIDAGVNPADANAAAAAATPHLAAGSEIHAILVIVPGDGAGGGVLQQLRATRIDGSGVILARAIDGSYAVTPLVADVTRNIKVLRGEIDSESFYTSAVSAGLIDTLIPEFINAFSYDFNLASEVSPGDVFEVAYDQEVNGQGESIGQPKLLYAQLTTAKKSLALYRFQSGDGDSGWFDGNGATTKRGLMRTPVDGARITSKFGMRFHPVLHYNKLHGGTDFAAPTGTPIFAAADGTIEFAAMKGANGNLTILRHDNGWATFYLHQNVFAPGIAAGTRVTQGQRIGDVGTTGRSTGPHLHYEVHIDGERIDPLSIPTDEASRKRLDSSALQAFLKERDRIDTARSQRSN